MKLLALLLSLPLVSGGCKTLIVCPSVPLKLSHADVSGSWIGFAGQNTDLYKLELLPNSLGLLTRVYTGATNMESEKFEISSWRIESNDLFICAFQQPGKDDPLRRAWPMKMVGQLQGGRMEVTLQNGEGGWTVSISFWREKDLNEKLKLLQ